MGCGPSAPAGQQASSPATRVGATVQKVGKDGAKIASDSVKVATGTVTRVFREPSIAVHKSLLNLPERMKAVGDKAKNAAHHVKNVFALPFDETVMGTYKTPVHEKSNEDRKLIEKALHSNFVFEHLSPRELTPLVLAFEEVCVDEKNEIIKQGDEGNYFYVVKNGRVAFEVDGERVGEAATGDSFGELALLYNCPRAASVIALTKLSLFQVDQKSFRYIMQSQLKEGNAEKLKLLDGVEFLRGLSATDKNKLAGVMVPYIFHKGDYIITKGDEADAFYIIHHGTVRATDIEGYEDTTIHEGSAVGEHAIVTGKPRAATVIAETDGDAFKIDKDTFSQVLGNLNELVTRSMDKTKLAGIKCFADSDLNSETYRSIASLVVEQTYKAGVTITNMGKLTEAALYFVRSGKVKIMGKSGERIATAGGYFGAEMLLHDSKTGKACRSDPSTTKAPETATVLSGEDCVCGVLYLSRLRGIIQTVHLGTGERVMLASFTSPIVAFQDVKRIKLLGAGTFGQVWLVLDKNKNPYALKVQSKYELCKDGQAKAVVNEKNIMAKLKHPFLVNLISSYQDDKCVYMLMGLLQGGELYSIIHTSRRDGVPDPQARFYAACVAEGLAFMHRRGYVYRDLKPENVMIGADGYVVIVDFGFAKHVPDKTYTLCGTPLYIAPEIVLNRGHNAGADHWSLGILIFELITGETPFYVSGMQQMDLFRAIVKGKFDIPPFTKPDVADIIDNLLVRDPTQRLGSLRGGDDDILKHKWFKPINFEKLVHKETTAPYIPKVTSPTDSSNFENWDHLEDKTTKHYPHITREQEKLFDGF